MGNAMSPSLLIVDDDVGFVHAAAEIARREGFEITVAGCIAQAIKRLQEGEFDLALLDLTLPDGNGMELLDHLDLGGHTQVVVVTGQPTLETTLTAIRTPIIDYVVKPMEVGHFRELLAKTVARRRPLALALGAIWHGLVGDSPALKRIKEEVVRVAPTDAAVLIHGESGVGKELVARAVHAASRRSGPFVALNCGAVPHELLASQLFGHEKGSFTGAASRHTGFFEQAHGGTLFLDEITEMPLHLQVHLLRALENGRIQRVGGAEEIAIDVRVISATNRSPRRAVQSGHLREDVFYRLAEFPIAVPPLRERPEDMEILAETFLARLNERYGTNKRFSPDLVAQLKCHHWPGNVRELRNAVQRVYILAGGDVVSLRLLEVSTPEPIAETAGSLTFAVGTSFEVMKRKMLMKTLAHFDNDKVRTAEALGISVKTIYNSLARYQDEGRGTSEGDEGHGTGTARGYDPRH